MSAAPRVIKLGGSLLDWPELADRFRDWLARQSPAASVVVAGGGAIVDAVRELDRAQSLSAETSHWLAIRAMSLTAALAARILSPAPPVRALAELRLSADAPVQVFEVERWLRDDARRADPLPVGWEVTGDSIAARLAHAIGASELVLLKSALPEPSASREALAQAGFVDAYFPKAAVGLSVRVVNLRDPEFPDFGF